MAILKTPIQGHKTPSYGARIVVRVSNGRAIFQKWPRKRGRVKHPTTLKQVQLFKERNILAKYAPGEDQWMAIELARNSPLYPRDLLMSAMAGRLFEILTVDGKVYRSVAVRDDISADLDLIGGDILGTMLLRGPDIWQALIPGGTNEVLTSQGPAALPVWSPSGSVSTARVGRSTNWTIPAGATTAVPWNNTVFDASGLWAAGQPTRLTMPNAAGQCIVNAGGVSTGNLGGALIGIIHRNGTSVVARSNHAGNGNLGLAFGTGVIDYAANDYFEFLIFSSFGGTMSTVEGNTLNVQLLS